MKDFDTGRQERKAESERTRDLRTFTIKGEQFVVSANVHPDVIAEFEELQESDSSRKTLEVVDNLIVSMLEGDIAANAARWRTLRADRVDPISIDDLLELSQWMIEQVTGRPTGQPGVSSPGLDSTKTMSTVASSSPDEVVAAAI